MTDDKKILEWLGFSWHIKREYVHGYMMHGGEWEDGHWDYEGKCWYGDGGVSRINNPPDIDLNFLFREVVPKLKTILPGDPYFSDLYSFLDDWIYSWCRQIDSDKDPAEAFKQALIKLIEEEK